MGSILKAGLSIFFLSLGLVIPVSSSATKVDATDPVRLIKTLSDRIFLVLEKQSDVKDVDAKKITALLEKELLPYVNIEHTTQLAFGKIWRKATPNQQKELIDLFKTLIVRTYSAYVDQIKDQKIVVFSNPLISKDFVTVRSRVENKNLSQTDDIVLYRLEKTESGWKVFDVQVASAWLILTYRGQFNDMINKSPEQSVEELITEIRKKTNTE